MATRSQTDRTGARELGLVDIGRAEQGHHLFTFVDREAVDLGVAGSGSRTAHDRRLPAQHLLHHRRHAVGLFDDPAPRFGVLGEVAEEAVERRGDRVEPRDEEQEANIEDLFAGEPVAVDIDVQEVADEVVALLARRLVDDLLEVGVDRIGDLLLIRLGLGVAELAADDLVGPDRAVLHRQEARQFLQRQPEQGQEDLRRKRRRELPAEVDFAFAAERVDQIVDQLRGRVLQQLHTLRGEEGIEELSVLPVVGRVDL